MRVVLELTDQYAVLYRPGRGPVEHSCAVILHLGRNEIEVPGLVISDAHIEPSASDSITRSVGRPDRKMMKN